MTLVKAPNVHWAVHFDKLCPCEVKMKSLNLDGTVRYSKEFSAIAEKSIRPAPVDFTEAEVSFSVDEGIFAEYIDAEYAAIRANIVTENQFPFSKEEFVRYCKTLLNSRIAWVCGVHEFLIIRPEDKIVCPALLAQVLMNIGTASDNSLGIVLNPSFGFSDDEAVRGEQVKELKAQLMTKAEVQQLSYYLRNLENYVGALGYLKDKSGSWDFMTMSLVDNSIRNHQSVSHPVYALLAAVVGTKQVASLLNQRVKYGDVATFRALIWQLVSI